MASAQRDGPNSENNVWAETLTTTTTTTTTTTPTPTAPAPATFLPTPARASAPYHKSATERMGARLVELRFKILLQVRA